MATENITATGPKVRELDWTSNATQIAESAASEFMTFLDNVAEQLALLRGANEVTGREVIDAKEQLLSPPKKHEKRILAHIAYKLGVASGAVITTTGVHKGVIDVYSGFLVGGGLLIIVLAAVLEYHMVYMKN